MMSEQSVALLATVVSVFCFIGCGGAESGNRPRQIYTSVDLKEIVVDSVLVQKPGRVWRPVQMSRTATIIDTEDAPLYKPRRQVGDSDGNVYVYDSGDYLIKKYDRNGNFVRSYGSGQGEGPGEISRGTKLSLLGDSLISILDGGSREIDHFRINSGEFTKSGSFDGRVLHYDYADNGGRFTYSLSTDHYFHYVDSNIESDFPPLKKGGIFGRIHFDGYMATYRSDMIYLPKFYGVFLGFSPDGSRSLAAQTIGDGNRDGPEVVQEQTRAGYRVFMKPGFDIFALSMSISNDRIYVQGANLAESDSANTVIDVYELPGARYTFSTRFAGNYRAIEVKGEYLFALSDTSITTYSMDW